MLTGISTSKFNIHDLSGKPELDKFGEGRFLEDPLLLGARSSSQNVLPMGFPNSVFSKRTWSPSDLRDRDDFVIQLDRNDIHEIEQALEHFKGGKRLKPSSTQCLTYLIIKQRRIIGVLTKYPKTLSPYRHLGRDLK